MAESVRIFTDLGQYQPSRRADLADLLRPLINQRSLDENRAIYGAVVDQYIIVETIGQADWAVLPFNWNYYHQTRHIKLAMEFIHQARQAGKPVITWVNGDFGARVPDPEVWIFGAAGNKKSSAKRRFGIPVFIRDPLREQGFVDIRPRSKQAKPRIGFCGYAHLSPLKSVAFTLKTLARNIASDIHLTGAEPQDLYPPVLLRQRILEQLRTTPLVESDFIQNTQYQGGAHTSQDLQIARQVFYNNIRSTDYTLCVRGSGNFSARLYETLAMGRIPIFVDTDCLLPYATDPRWQECCVYLRQEQIGQVAEIVTAFHNRLSGDEFIAVQYQARRFWEERLSMEGFFLHFPEHFTM